MVAEIVLVSGGEGTDAARQGAQYVARGLSAIGHKVREQISVCENIKQLQKAVSVALGRSHILVTLGGLDREAGYMTKTTIAQGLGLPLELNNEALNAMRSYCHRTGDPYYLEDNELCKLPKGSAAFPGAFGKVPGCVISSSKQHIIMLPDNQSEIIPMFNRYVSPYLGGKATTTVTRTVRTYGVTEHQVRDMLAGMLGSSNPAITIHREGGEVLVRVSANAETAPKAAAMCTPLLHTIVDRIGDAAYGLDVESLQSALISKLNKREMDIAIAESCTGGILTRVIAETEGGQQALRYSVAVDDDEAKIDKLGFLKKTLKKKGGVSEAVAVEMAAAVREKAHTGIGVAITACTSQNESKKNPLGLVYIAVCDQENVYVKKLVVGDGDASDDAIIDAALSRALNMARLFVDYLPSRYPGAIPLFQALEGRTVTDKDRYDGDMDLSDPYEFDEGEERSGVGGKVRKAIFILALLVFIGSTGYLANYLYNSAKATRTQDALNNLFGDYSLEEIPDNYPREFTNLKFAGLWNENPDVRGFISIAGTSVSYPIVQADDNDYYLRRDFYEKSNQYGIPFFDYRDDVKRPSDNLVVYGHNMTDGKIFGELVKYSDLAYYKEHPVIDLSTVYDDGEYKIFSVFITNAYQNQGHVFDYHNFIDAQNEAQFEAYLEQLRYRSLINTPVDVRPGDELLTLSTCSYELKDMRTVIVARKVRKNEDPTVDVSMAVLNDNPLYPDIWYQAFGGSPPEGVDRYWTVGDSASNYVAATAAAARSAIIATVPEGASGVNDSGLDDLEEFAAERARSRREEQQRLASESEAEAARLAAEAEQSRLAFEAAEAARVASESEAELARQAYEAEQARLASEAEAERLASEAEASRIASESEAEASRLESEAEEARRAASRQEEMVEEVQYSGMSYSAGEDLTVKSGGSTITADAYTIVSKIVENEVGASFHTEAIKAQALATYSYIAHQNASGTVPSVYMNESVSSKVQSAVSSVMGQAVYYGGGVAFTPYHATSAGATTSSATVWGGSYPYLVSVDSSVDESNRYYRVETTMTSSEVRERLSSRIGIQASGDPSSWIEILDRNDGGYVGAVRVCGQTKSSSGTTLNGRVIRESVLNLRSANFDINYNSSSDKFTFVTYGYGHGVGMSQNGANAYAAQGWDYVRILEHYFPGTTVR